MTISKWDRICFISSSNKELGHRVDHWVDRMGLPFIGLAEWVDRMGLPFIGSTEKVDHFWVNHFLGRTKRLTIFWVNLFWGWPKRLTFFLGWPSLRVEQPGWLGTLLLGHREPNGGGRPYLKCQNKHFWGNSVTFGANQTWKLPRMPYWPYKIF